MDGWLEGAVEGVCESWFEKQKLRGWVLFSNSFDVHKFKWATWTLHSSHTGTRRLMKQKHLPSSPHTFNCLRWVNSKGAHRWAEIHEMPKKGFGDNSVVSLSEEPHSLTFTFPRWLQCYAWQNRCQAPDSAATCRHASTHKATLSWFTDKLT